MSDRREGEIGLAKDLIDWIFMNHDHLALRGTTEQQMEELESLLPRPFVDSLELEAFIKERFPELKDYWYGKE